MTDKIKNTADTKTKEMDPIKKIKKAHISKYNELKKKLNNIKKELTLKKIDEDKKSEVPEISKVNDTSAKHQEILDSLLNKYKKYA